MTSEVKLEPCPHCGAALTASDRTRTASCQTVDCINYQIPIAYQTPGMAERWNRRASPPAPAVAVPEGWRETFAAVVQRVKDKGLRIEREANAMQDVGASLEAKIRIKMADEFMEMLAAAPQPPATRSYEEGRHEFTPNKQYPYFCERCGYDANETLQHTAIRSLKGPRDE